MTVTNGINGNATNGLHGQQLLYIDGKDVKSMSELTFGVMNPMTGEKLFDCASAGTADFETAIDAADHAFESWSQSSPSTRRLVFLKAADILEGYLNKDGPEILANEVSATKSWIKVNILATANIFRETAGLATQIKGDIVPADRPGTTILITREAIGVVFAISPWNAPVNLTARAIASPLICGNTVILKPSEYSPKSQYLVVRALREAGLPAGCLNFLPTRTEDAAAVTELGVKHPKVRRINYTGSDRVGRIIAGWAASCLKQCILELGGKAPVLVLEDANIDDAAESIVFGGFSNNGQICMSTERVIVHSSAKEALTEAILQRLQKLTCGNHHEAEVSLSGLYTPQSAIRFLSLVKSAVASGANVLAGDQQAKGPNGTIVQPHVLQNVTPEMKIFHEESFGPLVCMTEASSDNEAIMLANTSEYSLSAAVFSRDIMRALAVAKRVRAGSCHVNGPTVYIEATLPNGGTGGRSGYGRLGGVAGIEEYTEKKIISLAQSGAAYPF